MSLFNSPLFWTEQVNPETGTLHMVPVEGDHPEATLVWAEWFDQNRMPVGSETVGGTRVSTMPFGTQGCLYETMTFPDQDLQIRSNTRSEAMIVQAVVVAGLKRGLTPSTIHQLYCLAGAANPLLQSKSNSNIFMTVTMRGAEEDSAPVSPPPEPLQENPHAEA